MAQLLISLCDIWTSQQRSPLCRKRQYRHTCTQARSILSVTHGSPAKQAVLFLYLEAGPAMASPELGNSEAKVPSFLSQRASFLADVQPWPSRAGVVHALLCSWGKIHT